MKCKFKTSVELVGTSGMKFTEEDGVTMMEERLVMGKMRADNNNLRSQRDALQKKLDMLRKPWYIFTKRPTPKFRSRL